jgi:hypothetical protein
MWISIRSMIFALCKGIGALGLGGAILWQVVIHIGPQHGIAYVHVSTRNVDVMIDDEKYHIETLWESPITLEQSPGAHVLRMSRRGQLLYEENFSLGVGQDIVLIAWERASEAAEHNPAFQNRLASQIWFPLPAGRQTP